MEKIRSKGVTMVGRIIMAIGAVVLAFALYMFIGNIVFPYQFEGFGYMYGIIFSFAAIFIIIVGRAILKLKPWARTTVLVLSGLSLFNNGLMFIYAVGQLMTIKRTLMPQIFLYIQAAGIIIAISLIVFLTRPAVREQFK